MEESPALLQPPRRPPSGLQGSSARQLGQRPAPPYRRRYDLPRHAFTGLRVHQVMSREVTAVHAREPLQHAAQIMADRECGALPVLGDRRELVGMLTDRDIAVRAVARGRDPCRAIVADCMTSHPYACHAASCVLDCMREMAQRRVRRVPVLGNRGELVGMITHSDLARYAALAGNPLDQRALCSLLCAVCEPDAVSGR
jgi:CBS domain-containing protein